MKVVDVIRELESRIETAKKFASADDAWNCWGVLLELSKFLVGVVQEVETKRLSPKKQPVLNNKKTESESVGGV